MAWIDDRIWCHPKTAGLSGNAFATYVKGVAYSSGMGTSGYLDPGVQKLIGSTAKVRAELVAASLWDENGDGRSVVIHDWDEHNEKRDERRQRDLERKRRARKEGRWNEADRSRMGRAPDAPQTADGARPGAR